MAGTISTSNYTIGGGVIYFAATVAHADLETTATFETAVHSLGNITNVEINPEITYIDHFVSSSGKRVKDKVVANTVQININFVAEEMNENNLKRFFMGTMAASVISPLQSVLAEGSAHLKLTTTVGQDMLYRIPKCTLKPNGALSLSEDNWHSCPFVLECLEYSTGDGSVATWISNPFGKLDTKNQ